MNLRNALDNVLNCELSSDYDARNGWVLLALYLAYIESYNCGVKIDPKEPEWPVAFINLPTGQVSWHIPQYAFEWDGHDNEEKTMRVKDFIES